MKKNGLLKFISVLQIIISIVLIVVSVASLVMAFFHYFEATDILATITEKANIVNVIYLYFVNFLDFILVTVFENTLVIPVAYKEIILSTAMLILWIMYLIFACVSSKVASGKTQNGKAACIVFFIIKLLVNACFVAFAVYYYLYSEVLLEYYILNSNIAVALLAYGAEFSELIATIAVYSVGGYLLFCTLFEFLGVVTLRRASANASASAGSAGYGSYNPKMKPQESLAKSITFEEKSYASQDKNSSNPYINGKASLTEDDLFGDLKPKQTETSKPNFLEDKPTSQPQTRPVGLSTPSTPFSSSNNAFNNQNPYTKPNTSPFATTAPYTSQNNFNRPTSFATPSAPNQNPYMQNSAPNPFASASNVANPFMAGPRPASNPFMQTNSFASQPTQQQANPYASQNMAQAPAGTQNQPVSPVTLVINQPAAQTAKTPAAPKTTTPKSASEAFSAAPKKPVQALATTKSNESLTDKLKELSTLRQSGAISDDEYKALKQKAFQRFLKN